MSLKVRHPHPFSEKLFIFLDLHLVWFVIFVLLPCTQLICRQLHVNSRLSIVLKLFLRPGEGQGTNTWLYNTEVDICRYLFQQIS